MHMHMFILVTHYKCSIDIGYQGTRVPKYRGIRVCILKYFYYY